MNELLYLYLQLRMHHMVLHSHMHAGLIYRKDTLRVVTPGGAKATLIPLRLRVPQGDKQFNITIYIYIYSPWGQQGANRLSMSTKDIHENKTIKSGDDIA